VSQSWCENEKQIRIFDATRTLQCPSDLMLSLFMLQLNVVNDLDTRVLTGKGSFLMWFEQPFMLSYLADVFIYISNSIFNF